MVGDVFRQGLLCIQVLPTHPQELNTHLIFVFLLLLAAPDSLPHSYDRGGEDECFQFESQDGSLGNILVSFKTDSPATDVDSNTSEEFLFELFGAYRPISQVPYFTESWENSLIFQDVFSLTGEDTFLNFRSLPSIKYFIVFSRIGHSIPAPIITVYLSPPPMPYLNLAGMPEKPARDFTASVALLFWYVLQIIMSLAGDERSFAHEKGRYVL